MSNSNIVRFTGGSQYDPSRLPAVRTRTARQMEAAVEEEAMTGVIATARVEATAYVAQTGLAHVAALTELETKLAARDPQGAERYQAVIDTFTGAVITEVTRMSRDRRYGR